MSLAQPQLDSLHDT